MKTVGHFHPLGHTEELSGFCRFWEGFKFSVPQSRGAGARMVSGAQAGGCQCVCMTGVRGWNQQAEKPAIRVDSFQENSTKIWHLIPGGMTSRRGMRKLVAVSND